MNLEKTSENVWNCQC